MKQIASPRTLLIRKADQAKYLLDRNQRRYLEPFMSRELTIQQAAEEIGVRSNTLLYAVRRMVTIGLLEVVRIERRKGRAMQVYCSSADIFFLPHTILQKGGLEEAIAQVDLEGEQLLRQNIVYARSDLYPTWGFRMFRNTDNLVYINAALDPEHDLELLGLESPAAFSSWLAPLHLDFADAKNLQRELFGIWERYRTKQGAQRYMLRLGMAPLLKE